MNLQQYNAYCESLPATTHVVQWGGAHVWKIGGKVFAIGWFDGGYPAVTFKVSPMAYDMMQAEPGLRPAPYLASRGMKWIQNYTAEGLSDKDLQAYLNESYKIVARGLTKKARISVNFED
jgi:predicted DNA-binding protein (MmcQ/YjbR family)